MKFLVDMALSPGLARWLNDLGYDAVHASGLGMNQSPDEDLLARADRDQRILVTADLDFPRLLAMSGSPAPALILLRGGQYSERESIDCVRRVLALSPGVDLANTLAVVDSERVRIRRLPLSR